MRLSEIIPKIKSDAYIKLVDTEGYEIGCFLAFVAMGEKICYGYEVERINPISENEIAIVVKKGE